MIKGFARHLLCLTHIHTQWTHTENTWKFDLLGWCTEDKLKFLGHGNMKSSRYSWLWHLIPTENINPFNLLSFLFQALCGCTVSIPTLENRIISLPCHDIIKPGTVKRLRGEGLPFPKNPSQRGDLIVEFSVRFPDRIPPQSREIIRQHLPQS